MEEQFKPGVRGGRSVDAVTLLSGGMDSTVLLYDLLKKGYTPHALSVNYGQRHKRELDFARSTCRHLGVDHKEVDFSALNVLLQGSALTSSGVPVPEGHYSADNMAITVVPNRNAILLAIATGWAVSLGAQFVSFAAHAGDHAQYPDCRFPFVNAMGLAMIEGNLGFISPHFAILSPYVNMTKTDIARVGKLLDVPFENTWSCYKGGELHCGRCGTCVERLEALHEAGVQDRTRYEDSEYWKEAVAGYKNIP